jgi:hypothetical protein
MSMRFYVDLGAGPFSTRRTFSLFAGRVIGVSATIRH